MRMGIRRALHLGAVVLFSVLVLSAPQSLAAVPRLARVEIPMDAGLLYPTPSQDLVACVRRVMTKPDVNAGNSTMAVRICMISVDSKEIIATLDLADGDYRFAVSNQYLFAANNDSLELCVYAVETLAQHKRVPLSKPVGDLHVIDEKLVCSSDGNLRLAHASLNPSSTWAAPPRTMPIRRYHEGWYIDGVIWDESLTAAKMIHRVPSSEGFPISR